MRSHYLALLFSACVAASAHPGTLGMSWKPLGAEEHRQTHTVEINFGVCLQEQTCARPSSLAVSSCESLSCSLSNDTHKPSPCEFHPKRQQQQNAHRWSTPSPHSSASSWIPEATVSARKASHLLNCTTQQTPPTARRDSPKHLWTFIYNLLP